MDLDADMESILCNLDQPSHTIQHACSMDMVGTDIFYEDESFVFQSAIFETELKKLIIEKRDVKNNKRKHLSELDLANMNASKIYELHRETRDVLHDSVGVIEAENDKLKNQIKELEEALFHMPLLGNSLEISMSTSTCTLATNLKGSSSFLASCR
jgi:hypothetical protein